MAEEFTCGPDGCGITPDPDVKPVGKEHDSSTPVIVTTKTCPHCKAVKEFLTDNGIAYTEVYADEDPDFVMSQGIMTAPTLILPDGTKLVGESEIRGYYA